jgi:rsbT antagonist protein RsbS
VNAGSPSTRVPLNLVRGCMVVTTPPDVSPETIGHLRVALLDRVRETGARRIVVDVSAVQTMDTEDFRSLVQLIASASLMGARTVLAGLQPGVAASLVELGVEGGTLETALDLDDAFERLEQPMESDEGASAEWEETERGSEREP